MGDCEYKNQCGIYKPEIADCCDILRHLCLYRQRRIHEEDRDKLTHFHNYEEDSHFGIIEHDGQRGLEK